MYRTIMTPVDLAHAETLGKALDVSAALAKAFDASLTMVSVAASAPSDVAISPTAHTKKLKAFAAEQGEKRGVTFAARLEIDSDPVIDLEQRLEEAAEAIGADLVVMASHVPGWAEYIFASNAGYLASHSKLSVLVVR